MDRYYEILAEAEAANKLVEKQDTLPPEKLRGFLRQLFTTDTLVRNTEFQKKVLPSWDAWAKLSEKERQARVEKLSEERNRLLDLKTDLENKQQTLSRADANRLNTIEFELDLGGWRKNARPNEGLEPVLRQYEARPWAKLAKAEERRQAQSRSFRLVVYEVLSVLVWPRNDRFERVGENWPELPKAPLDDLDLLTADVDKAQQAAVQAALTNRVDLMNARAQVVDAWRQLRVTANALMGIFNVQYHLDSVTPKDGTRPLAFSPATTNQTLSLNAQLPLVRVAERNEYRTALINYQRARRSLMNLEDNIATTVRFDVRQLHLFAENYKIQQKLLESLYTQVENALEVIVSPVDPDSLKTSGTGGAANAAALTNQYLGALSGLNGAQANMYRIWLSYLATRMALYLDLERLPLDNRGVWIDESGKSLSPCVPPGSATLGQPFSDPERGSPAFERGPRVGLEYLPPPAPPRVE